MWYMQSNVEHVMKNTLVRLGERWQLRVREHKDATRLDQSSKSAVAEHVHNHDIPHSIDWESVVVLDKARSKFNIDRKMRESFHIHQRQPKMNRDQGIERSKTWNSVL